MSRRCRALLVIALAAGGACRQTPPPREYELVGQILEVRPARSEVVITHQDIKNFMPGMTMPFKVKDVSLMDGKEPGDLVTATLVVEEVNAYISTLVKTGHQNLPATNAAAPEPAEIRPGDPVADAALLDQNGTSRHWSSWRGHRVALTFVYTRCPLPEFCPKMDRQFAEVQRAIAKAPNLADVQLVSMTLDPAHDTPAVLNAHARTLGANQKVWTFVTAAPDEARRFGEQFGVFVERDAASTIEITHNLRTAVIDAEGRLVRVHTGNDWTPADLVADLTATAPPAH